jgi:16S rRNA processing protein RimM
MPTGGSEWLCAGRISGAYGIKGWVKVHALTDDPDSLLGYTPWQLRWRDRRRDIEVEAGRRHGRGLVAKLRDCDDRDAAEQFRGTEIWVPAEELPALEAGDFYWHDLVDLRVSTEFEGRTLLLGEVDHLLETGANDVLVLRPCPGSIDDRERLVPYLPGAVVESVLPEEGLIKVRWHPED